MDRLEFLVEERSMAEVLKVLLPRILPASWVLDENYFIRPHEGKSDLKRSIPKKLKGFAQHKEQTTGFIIIQDQDSNDCRQLKQELVALCKANYLVLEKLYRFITLSYLSLTLSGIECFSPAMPLHFGSKIGTSSLSTFFFR